MENWQPITEGFNLSSPLGEINDKTCGFVDIDGFFEKEIYAVGVQGDIWTYDGTQWGQCGFPTNDYLYAVCCAKDGYVYVAARNALWCGKGHRWEQVTEFEQPAEINDIRWFANKIWIAYDYRIDVWDGKELQNGVIYNGEKLPLSGAIDASDDMLLVASSFEVWTYDGNDWYNIVPNWQKI